MSILTNNIISLCRVIGLLNIVKHCTNTSVCSSNTSALFMLIQQNARSDYLLTHTSIHNILFSHQAQKFKYPYKNKAFHTQKQNYFQQATLKHFDAPLQ